MSKYESRYHLKLTRFNLPRKFIKPKYHMDEVVQIMKVLDGNTTPPSRHKCWEYYLWDDIKKWCLKNGIPIENNYIQCKYLIDINLPEMDVPKWLELYLFLDGHRIFYKLSAVIIPQELLSIEYVVRLSIKELISLPDVGTKTMQKFLCKMADISQKYPSYLYDDNFDKVLADAKKAISIRKKLLIEEMKGDTNETV